MANYSNSSLYPWLSYEGQTFSKVLACKDNSTGSIKPVSCAQVCNDTQLLFTSPFQTSNLWICGFWSALIISLTNLDTGSVDPLLINGNSTENSKVAALLNQFENVGLNSSSYHLAPTYADLISGCFVAIYYTVKEYTFADNQNVNEFCTRWGLFPPFGIGSSGSVENLTESGSWVESCLDALCASNTLDPDLAGIGVCLSRLMNSVSLMISA